MVTLNICHTGRYCEAGRPLALGSIILAFTSIYWSPSNGIGLPSLHIDIGCTTDYGDQHGNLLQWPGDILMLTTGAHVTHLPPYAIAFTNEILVNKTWQCTAVFMVIDFRIWFIKHCVRLLGPPIYWCITYCRQLLPPGSETQCQTPSCHAG